MNTLNFLTNLSSEQFESQIILKKLAEASRSLAEFKGVISSIPNRDILLNTLSLQEAKDSSAIENIVTTHDELFKGGLDWDRHMGPASKEVSRYREALMVGMQLVNEAKLITSNHLIDIQAVLERNAAGFRKVSGTTLKDNFGNVVYTPPQDNSTIVLLMSDLEKFINNATYFDADPLIKMAIAHHQFESIHPFYDGNGRTGRILNVLYLVKENLLDSPILYLSNYIVRTKQTYYDQLQNVRDTGEWDGWIMYMLTAVDSTARKGISTVRQINNLVNCTREKIKNGYSFYSQDMVNSLFAHPYTKIQFIEKDLGVSRMTAAKYLDELASDGILEKHRLGRNNYYVNRALFSLFGDLDNQ